MAMAQRRGSMAAVIMVAAMVLLACTCGPSARVEGAACSPFLLLNCVGTRGADDARCCAAVKEVLQPACFCSEYRKGVVDASSIVPLAKRCQLNLRIGANCRGN